MVNESMVGRVSDNVTRHLPNKLPVSGYVFLRQNLTRPT